MGVLVLTVALAWIFSSPDEKPITLADWAAGAPNDVIATAAGELAGTTTSAGYGPPYNSASDGQSIGPLHLQKWAGVTIPVDPANDLVLTPLSRIAGDPALTVALARYTGASADQQAAWSGDYVKALAAAPDNDPAQVAPGDYGPVPLLAQRFLNLARSGGLEGVADVSGHLLRHRRHPQPAAAGRRRLPGGPGPRPTARRGPVGHDERDRQLPRPALDVALHLLVPGAAVLRHPTTPTRWSGA